jgi:hypothetical protein
MPIRYEPKDLDAIIAELEHDNPRAVIMLADH